jgi:hypothetical protein
VIVTCCPLVNIEDIFTIAPYQTAVNDVSKCRLNSDGKHLLLMLS